MVNFTLFERQAKCFLAFSLKKLSQSLYRPFAQIFDQGFPARFIVSASQGGACQKASRAMRDFGTPLLWTNLRSGFPRELYRLGITIGGVGML